MSKQLLIICILIASCTLVLVSDAKAQALYVTPGGDVGVGTDLPSSSLHVLRNLEGFPALFKLENLGSDFAGFRFTTLNGDIDFNKAGGNSFRLNMVDGDPWELNLDPDGNLTITGEIITNGTCFAGCDAVFSPEYGLPTIEEHAEAMWRNSFLPAVGPSVEGQPFNLTFKTQAMLNELEKAHIFIDQLNTQLKQKENMIAELDRRLERLEALVK
jgi:hypothetical protein